ncbi:MAG: AbrB/MazE/SpoVT family DNA-binding domain-containing protein [Candidatus Competibacteraceae bacterium]|nr:AbrB/MazE/SpoVT family DNA-binding domain-containing protein [Candidatus Competibacteraceae bacterium]
MQTSTLTAKGQVTIPVEVRRLLNLKSGDQVAFVVEDGRITLVRSEDRIEAAFGLVKAELSVSRDDMDRAIQEQAGR